VSWTDPARIPIDPETSSADHFIPGLAVDPATAGASTHLALTYYFYPNANCGGACRLDVGYISSPDGGAHWGAATQLAGPMGLSQIANTSQGPMVGDYISTSFAGGTATTVFAVGRDATTAPFNEAMYSPGRESVASLAQATQVASSTGVFGAVGNGETHHALKDN